MPPPTIRGTTVARSASSSTTAADLPAELERHPRHPLAAQAHDPLAGGGRSGEGDLVDAGVGDEVLADLAAAGHDVDHAGRHAGLVEGLGQHEVAQRRLGRRLEHDRAARGQRRGHLPGRQRDRGVPGDDGGDHADRLVGHQAGAVAGDHRALELERADQVGVVVEHRRHQAGLGRRRLADRAAHLVDGDAGDVGLRLRSRSAARASTSARSPGAMRGHGPSSNAVRAASTARSMSAVGGQRDLADDLPRSTGRRRRGVSVPAGWHPAAADVELPPVHQPVVHAPSRIVVRRATLPS